MCLTMVDEVSCGQWSFLDYDSGHPQELKWSDLIVQQLTWKWLTIDEQSWRT